MRDVTGRLAILAALGAALLFGASTPFAKLLSIDIPPTLLAGLLYLGSGIGLWTVRLVRDRGVASALLRPGEWGWLIAATAFGGLLGPILLMYGLTRTSGAEASLLLNLEAVFTAALAWSVFRENADRRIVLGMALIVAGGIVLAWPARGSAFGSTLGRLAITAACLCWAIDNNLTRKLSASDALFIAAMKGLLAGATNLTLALAFGASLPHWSMTLQALIIGLLGYGLSLVLFVVALRGLGAARTGAYFSTAPFIGAAIAMVVLKEPASAAFWVAAVLMAAGVWLHLTERHEHEHAHEALLHTHSHRHAVHHEHSHSFPWDGQEPHTHEHRHESLTHSHPHYPDIHHQHGH